MTRLYLIPWVVIPYAQFQQSSQAPDEYERRFSTPHCPGSDPTQYTRSVWTNGLLPAALLRRRPRLSGRELGIAPLEPLVVLADVLANRLCIHP